MSKAHIIANVAVLIGGAILTAAVPVMGLAYAGAVAFMAVYTYPIPKYPQQ